MTPPTLAERLLTLFGADALTGDLIERAPTQSRWWLWKQVIAVVASGSWVTLRAHKVVAIRTFFVGGGVLWLWKMLLNAVTTQLTVGVLMSVKFWWWHHIGVSIEPLTLVLVASAAGWSTGRMLAIVNGRVGPQTAVGFLATYLICACISLGLFAAAILRDPHHYIYSEWATVAVTVSGAMIVLPVGIVAGSLGRHQKSVVPRPPVHEGKGGVSSH
jgi:hypothetical protein